MRPDHGLMWCYPGTCRGLQIPHFQAAFSAAACCALHRIAFPVVSRWCQKVCRSRVACPCSSLAHAHRYAAPPGEVIAST